MGYTVTKAADPVTPYTTVVLDQVTASKLWTLAQEHCLTPGDYLRSLIASYCLIKYMHAVRLTTQATPMPVGKDGKVRVRIRGTEHERVTAIAYSHTFDFAGPAELAVWLLRKKLSGKMPRRKPADV